MMRGFIKIILIIFCLYFKLFRIQLLVFFFVYKFRTSIEIAYMYVLFILTKYSIVDFIKEIYLNI